MHEELRGKRRDGKVEAAKAKARQAEDDADGGRRKAGQHDRHEKRQPVDPQVEIIGRESTGSHECGRTKRDLPRIASEKVEADPGKAEGKEWQQDCLEEVTGAHERHDEIRDSEHPDGSGMTPQEKRR